jgi:carbamoyltransferase
MKDVISLLNKGNVVGLVQGRAEAGPRALGNRSLLLDPTLKTAKKIMNDIKKREWFRPFACSILEEEADNYFYMQGIKKTPHMMHAPVAKLKAKNRIFSLIHTDNTCRVQTVNEKDNSVLYKLLKNFKVPVLMNTSFNLAGYPMVETFKDILHMVKNSSLKYVYFSDYNKILIDEKKRKNDEEKR